MLCATDRTLTRATAVDMLNTLAKQSGSGPFPPPPGAPAQPITRAELAAWLDARLDPFHHKAVNWQGNFVPMKVKAGK